MNIVHCNGICSIFPGQDKSLKGNNFTSESSFQVWRNHEATSEMDNRDWSSGNDGEA